MKVLCSNPEAGAIPSCIYVGRFNPQGVITESMLLVCFANGTLMKYIGKVHLLEELESSCSLQFMLNMRNEIASRDCELVVSHISPHIRTKE